MSEHLHHACKVMVRKVSTEAGLRLREHLRGVKALGFADDDAFDVGSNCCRRAMAIDVVVAARLKGFHEGALAAIAQSDDLKGDAFGVRMNDLGNLECAHLAHV